MEQPYRISKCSAQHSTSLKPCNIYCNLAKRFTANESIFSQEGTTQEGPLAIAVYAVGVTPLIHAVSTPIAEQVWFADNATTGGHPKQLHTWWESVTDKGPAFGYHANCSKLCLVVKNTFLKETESSQEQVLTSQHGQATSRCSFQWLLNVLLLQAIDVITPLMQPLLGCHSPAASTKFDWKAYPAWNQHGTDAWVW